MADYCKITKQGLRAYKWNDDLYKQAKNANEDLTDTDRFNIEFEPEPDQIWTYLRCHCEIDPGVTIIDIFNMVDKYDILKVFMQQYSWCKDIDSFHKQAKQPNVKIFDPDLPEEKVEYIEISQFAKISFGKFVYSYDFHGVGTLDGEKSTYSIEYSPTYTYADIELRINEDVEVYDYDQYKKNHYKNPVPIIAKAERGMSLLDILDAIYWEISFVGGPEDKEYFVESMREKVKTIEEDMVSGEINNPEKYGRCLEFEKTDFLE